MIGWVREAQRMSEWDKAIDVIATIVESEAGEVSDRIAPPLIACERMLHAVLDDAESELREARDEVRSSVRDELMKDDALIKEARVDLHEILADEVKLDLRDELRAEVRDELRDELRAEVRTEVRDELRAEVRAVAPTCSKVKVDSAIAAVFKRVLYAVSKDLAGVLRVVRVEAKDGHVSATGTDGHRLHYAEEASNVKFPAMVLPSHAVAEYVLLDPTTRHTLSVVDGHVVITDMTAKVIHTMRILDHEFPEWRSLLSTSASVRGLKQAHLRDAVKKVKAEEGAVIVRFHPMKGVTIDDVVVAADWNTATMDSVSDDGIAIKLNRRYLQEALRALPKRDAVDIEFSDALSPIVLRAAADMAVIMPMHR